MNANTQIHDRLIDRAAMIRLYEERLHGKIEVVLDGHRVRVDKLVREASLTTRGFKALQEAVDQELLSTYRTTYNISKRGLLDLAVDQVSYGYQAIAATFGDIWKSQKPQRRIAEEIVLSKPLYADKTLEDGWKGISLGEKKRIESTIRKGIAEGQSIESIALAVRKGNVHNISMYNSQALVTTAVTSVRAQADHAVYTANKDAIQGWEYVAVLDSRTTPICSHRDGTIYPVEDTSHLPPAHYRCRSTTVPVFKDWADIAKLEGVAAVRKRNLANLTDEQIAFYDGQTPLRETYNAWLLRQPTEVQLKHLGDYNKVDLFRSGQITVDKFTNGLGKKVGIKELRALTSLTPQGDSRNFALAKEKLDLMRLGAATPDDFINDSALALVLRDYYVLQAGELDGILSLTNYRGQLIHNKRATKQRVLDLPPTEDQMKFNPITGRYEDTRFYQPQPEMLANRIRLVKEDPKLLERDRKFIIDFVQGLDDRMSINERAVVADNLRIIFGRQRENGDVWANFKAVAQGQIKYDVTNISEAIETTLRKDSDVLKKLLLDNYIDPVLGPIQLQELSDNLVSNILSKNKWEDTVAPKIARELRNVFDYKIPLIIKHRLTDRDMQQFYLRFAHRLSLADSPDRDQFAVALGRDLYNQANLNGARDDWYNLGMKLLEAKNVSKFFEIETFGVQKRRMRSRASGAYFGPYYDTISYNLRLTDPRIQKYAKLSRSVELGLRVPVIAKDNRLVFREGFKTYFIDRGILGYEDTRIPITSTSSFSDFPEDFIDKDMVDALNWAAKSEYRIDKDYYEAVSRLLYFKDDKGMAKHYDALNEYRKHTTARGDTYERFKAMEWLVAEDRAFSNHPFIDHRARVYDRGLISPVSGEQFRPFLNTKAVKNFSEQDFYNFRDQLGAFLGGASEYFEGNFDSLAKTGRQKIAQKWHNDVVKIGNHLLRGKPNDLRAVLDNPVVAEIDGEELGKFYRFAIELAKIDKHLKGDYSKKALKTLSDYQTALALEQDASSSGAQIIALTTRNKALAEMSNVIPTTYKKRLYDEIAQLAYDDPRFIKMNETLGLDIRDLRKAAKAQLMVTFKI